MLTVYYSSGARDYDVGANVLTDDRWETFRRGAIRLLRARGNEEAAEILATYPFRVVEGSNFFGDEFVVLFASVDIDQYAELVERYAEPEHRYPFASIAHTLNELAPFFVRFIAFDAELEAYLPPVPEPELRITSRTVEQALGDARHLISSRGSTSGVDRAHTAFHGYLRVLCDNAGIVVEADADVTRLFRTLRDNHPSLQAAGPRAEDITHSLRALATVVNMLNPVRNQATLAHPNPDLLEAAEADLVLNCIHTLLHYLNHKLR